jgi:hypothetical protein
MYREREREKRKMYREREKRKRGGESRECESGNLLLTNETEKCNFLLLGKSGLRNIHKLWGLGFLSKSGLAKDPERFKSSTPISV